MPFLPDKPTIVEQEIPFFEDISAADVPGRRTEKTVEQIQKEISRLMQRLDAALKE